MPEAGRLRIGVLNGPKLDLLGAREPEHYGRRTLAEIEAAVREKAETRAIGLEFFQSNEEEALVRWIEDSQTRVDGWLVNAGILTHTSQALRGALRDSGKPFVELHLSNVFAREPFRRTSVLADLAVGVIAGFRDKSYLLALEALVDHLEASRDPS